QATTGGLGGDKIDSNFNAGLDIVRGASAVPNVQVQYPATGIPVTITPGQTVSATLSIADDFLIKQSTATSGSIIGATNASPISITTLVNHGLTSGTTVSISGVQGNTAANGTFTITVTSLNTFTLNGTNGNGNYSGGGVWTTGKHIQL